MTNAIAQDRCQGRESPLVLLVDDDDGIREALADFLEEEGFRVASARNGLEAMNFIAESDTPPALIVLDLMMPVMDGWTFCKVRQAMTKLRSIPVLALSATPMAGERAPIGVDANLSKPFDPERLTRLAISLTR